MRNKRKKNTIAWENKRKVEWKKRKRWKKRKKTERRMADKKKNGGPTHKRKWNSTEKRESIV